MCDCPHKPMLPARDTDQRAVILTGDGPADVRAVAAGHNRAEVLVSWDAGISAGDVEVYRREALTGAGNATVESLAASIAYNAKGARVVLEIPPGARLAFGVTGYTGSGPVKALLTSWRQG